MQNAPNPSFLQNEFRQVLSQTNLYMKQHGGRYGFIVTDQEFMAIEQLEDIAGHPLDCFRNH